MGPFFAAKASARPRIIQLTTINFKKVPRDAASSGVNAFMNISSTVTSAAITTINTGIRISEGTTFRIKEIAKLDNTKTKTTPNPIPIALSTRLVTARVGHIPRNCTKVGLDVKRPFFKTLVNLTCWSMLLPSDCVCRLIGQYFIQRLNQCRNCMSSRVCTCSCL